ncbi:hypothetical protein GQ651_15210 [Alphaproteobacteria bacterium GH1-50]|uniref:histidine kinase n=1 Tax=Kangsaoukella pontilimi TaxID=2691042 RepID=A0A7C9MYJ3_9RHOB|nr:ATP-binding protein [Kangsaoukella pontilimi]MXQ09194.1 hypothetical protein [Kangsaoukella pontilimi]
MAKDPDLARELRIDEAVEVVLASPRILIGMSFAFIILLANLGPGVLMGWAGLPAAVIFVMIYLAMSGFFRLRHRDRPTDVSARRMRSFLIFAVVMGAGWGIMLSLIIQAGDERTRTVALLLAFIGTFATTSINSTRVSMGFGFTTLGITWLTVLWTGALPAFGASVMFVLAYLTISYFAHQSQQTRIAAIKQTMANTRAMEARFQAEEDLRTAQIEAAEREKSRQMELSATQRNVINAIPFPLILARGDSALEVTPAARAQFGVSEATELSEITLSDFFVDPATPAEILGRIQADGELNDFETLMKNTSDEEFWVTISTRSLVYEGQKSWLNAIYVIDARKRMEQELGATRDRAVAALADLRKAQEQLIHAEKMAGLGQLTAGIAHEIKNPLNFVNNFAKLSTEMLDELAELLSDGVTYADDDTREDVEDTLATVRENLVKIDQHGGRADSIVKNMLSHSREGTGQRETVGLNGLVKEALNLAYHGARASDVSFNADIQTEWSDDVGDVTVVPQEIQRVFLNVISNGIYAAGKSAAAGGAPAQIAISTRAEGGDYVVDVTDNGPGIPEDARKRIFEPFYTTKPAGEGTGLGLSMSFDIVKAHGGRIDLTSAEGEGTTFTIRLPKAARGEAPE